jgi:HAD superfamily hydrolase (TIGR01458 family)
MAPAESSRAEIKGVLIDLGGVVYVGDRALPGAIDAVKRIAAARLPRRFITNTTRQSHRSILARLGALGLHLGEDELLTPARLARDYLWTHGLNPFLLVHPRLKEDFAGLPHDSSRNAILVGDAGSTMTYDQLNEAYRRLEGGAVFLALAKNRNFLDDDGALSLDAGPFVVALEYACRRTATLLGKPSPTFFKLAAAGLGLLPSALVMIGDDAEADVDGAMTAGMQGILVKTGKYRPGDELKLERPPTYVAADLGDAVDWLLVR